jgi:hypothetical protein
MISKKIRWNRVFALAFGAVALSGCATVKSAIEPLTVRETLEEREAREKAETRRRALEAIPLTPVEAAPTAAGSAKYWKAALAAKGTRVVVSTGLRALWILRDSTVVYRAPIAVGMHKPFAYAGKSYDFKTPIGKRTVKAKATNPLWSPPDWHYFEKAVDQNLEPVRLKAKKKYPLSDGTHIEVRGNEVGRVNQFDNFWPFSPGSEIIFDGKIFIPPFGTRQRQVSEILGTHKLELGDGYMIHGTNEDTSIGAAVSHGCVRMYNEDVAEVYAMVPQGTAVYIY